MRIWRAGAGLCRIYTSLLRRASRRDREIENTSRRGPTQWLTFARRRRQGPHVGMWLSRDVAHRGQNAGRCSAQIVGYLPAAESDFLDVRGDPAPLWRIRYVSGEIAGDVQDLELYEVESSKPTWETPKKKKKRKKRPVNYADELDPKRARADDA